MIRRLRLEAVAWCATTTITVLVILGVGVSFAVPPATAEDGCADIDVVVARGTQEPGHLGAEIGDPLYEALEQLLPSLSSYRVDYPADLLDPTSIPAGTQDLVAHLIEQSAQCPAQRFILVGYSQGAVVTEAALGTVPLAWIPGRAHVPDYIDPAITAVLLFGTPGNRFGWSVPDHYRARTGSWCTPGDPVCQMDGTTPNAHVAYADTLSAATVFAIARAG